MKGRIAAIGKESLAGQLWMRGKKVTFSFTAAIRPPSTFCLFSVTHAPPLRISWILQVDFGIGLGAAVPHTHTPSLTHHVGLCEGPHSRPRSAGNLRAAEVAPIASTELPVALSHCKLCRPSLQGLSSILASNSRPRFPSPVLETSNQVNDVKFLRLRPNKQSQKPHASIRPVASQ